MHIFCSKALADVFNIKKTELQKTKKKQGRLACIIRANIPCFYYKYRFKP